MPGLDPGIHQAVKRIDPKGSPGQGPAMTTRRKLGPRSLPAHEWRGRNVRIDESASISRSLLWDDIEIGAGAVLEECIVTDGVKVPQDAVYRRSILVRANGGISMTSFDAA